MHTRNGGLLIRSFPAMSSTPRYLLRLSVAIRNGRSRDSKQYSRYYTVLTSHRWAWIYSHSLATASRPLNAVSRHGKLRLVWYFYFLFILVVFLIMVCWTIYLSASAYYFDYFCSSLVFLVALASYHARMPPSPPDCTSYTRITARRVTAPARSTGITRPCLPAAPCISNAGG